MIKAITIHQPYAWAIEAGEKHYETRPRRTHYRGDLVIHASRDAKVAARHDHIWLWRLGQMLKDEERASIEIGNAASEHKVYLRELPLGVALCVVTVVDCVPVESIRDTLSARELAFGDYRDGRYAWKLENVRVFAQPIAVRGQQGLWNWTLPLPDEVAR